MHVPVQYVQEQMDEEAWNKKNKTRACRDTNKHVSKFAVNSESVSSPPCAGVNFVQIFKPKLNF